jgi:hypothetical protein
MASGPLALDKSVVLAAAASGTTVSHPAVAQLVDSQQVGGLRDVYYVAWTEQSGAPPAVVNARRVTWDRATAAFLTPSQEQVLTQSPRDVIAPAAVSDGIHFGLLLSSAAPSSPATIVFRSSCP